MRLDLRAGGRLIWIGNGLLASFLLLAAEPWQPAFSGLNSIEATACRVLGHVFCTPRSIRVEVRDESRTLLVQGRLELPGVEIPTTTPGISLVRIGDRVLRSQPLFQIDTTDLRREYQSLVAELQVAEAEDVLAQEKAWATLKSASASETKAASAGAVREVQSHDELLPLHLDLPSDDSSGVLLTRGVSHTILEPEVTKPEESAWIIPLVPALSRSQAIRRSLSEIQGQISNSRILSPVDGIVASLSTRDGSPGVTILAQQPELVLMLPVAEANNVEIGIPFNFTISNETGLALVYAVVPDDADKNLIRVLCRVQNTKPVSISGLTVLANLPMKNQKVINLPSSAILFDSKSPKLLIVVNGIVRSIDVKISNEKDSLVTVVDSLETGDRVVINPLATSEGQTFH